MTETESKAEMSFQDPLPGSLPSPSFTGFKVPPPTAPRLVLSQGAGFSSFSNGPSPWISKEINHKSPWIPKEGNEKDCKSQTEKSVSSTGQDLQGQCARLAACMSVEKTVERKPVPEFRGYDEADYASPEDGELRSHDDTSMSHHTDRDGRLSPVDFSEVAISKGPQLSEIDLRGLSPELVLFYFGVLRLQDQQLDPVVEYTMDADGRYSAKLTMYRDSLKIPALESMTAAKVEISRVALSILKVRCANWKVPDEPSENLTAFSWRWGQLLQAYAEDMKHPSPELTRYIHKNGFRYQVDVGKVDTGIVTSLGHRKFYETEDQAIEAASHEVLYLLLIQELQELQEATIAASRPEQLLTPTTDSLLPAKIEFPPVSNSVGSSRDLPRPVNDRVLKPLHSTNSPHRISKPARPDSKRKVATAADSFMSNLLPVLNPRISTNKAHDEREHTGKWRASPDQLTKAIAHLETYREKYDEICHTLGLSSQLEVVEFAKKASSPCTYTAYAKFQNDPFLARAGPIGLINGYVGSREEAEEKCCKKVVTYLLNLVREDHQLEMEEQAQRWEIDNYADNQRKVLGL